MHQHTPEIEDSLRSAGARNVRLDFVPISAPLVRGIFATSFVRVPARRLPEVVAVAGSNYAEVGLAFGPMEDGKSVVTVS